MNRFLKLFMVLLSLLIISGCTKKDSNDQISNKKQVQEISYDGNKLKATFAISSDMDARISTESDDFRTSREKAIIICENFKIGIEENDDLSFNKYSGDFKKFKKEHKNNKDYKALKISEHDAFVEYYASYMRYEVYIKVSDEYILKLNIYSTKDTYEDAKKQFESQVVTDLLNSIKVEVK